MNSNTSQQQDLERAAQMVERFVRRFQQPSYRLLAYHAALPLVLTPELLNYLRVQFLWGQVPWVAEVDLLLSDLCRQVGYELYAMDTAVRAYLLEEMKQELGEGRMQEVARLLISYVKYLHQKNLYISPKELQAQQWAAMVFLEEKRKQVVGEITKAFEKSGASTTGQGSINKAELAWLARITQELAPQLRKYPNLLDLANLVTKVIAGAQNIKAEDLRHYEILDKRLGLPEELIPDELKTQISSLWKRRKFLEQRLAKLAEEYTATISQSDLTVNVVDRLKLQRKTDKLLKELEVLENQLSILESQTSEDSHENLKKSLSEIDFKEARYIVTRVFEHFDRDYGAAIFLLEDVYPMAGELLVDSIGELLKNNTADIKKLDISFPLSSSNPQSDFLMLLGRFVAIRQKASSTEKEYSTKVIKEICSPLQNGTVVFLTIHRLDTIPNVEDFLSWFVHVFWANLISEIRLRKVRCVAVITSDMSLPPDYIASSDFCTTENFDPSKILKIPLYNWTEKDIEEWLIKYSGLPSTRLNLLAKQVYLQSRNGVPRMVIDILQQELMKT